jgi:hypothetical protein
LAGILNKILIEAMAFDEILQPGPKLMRMDGLLGQFELFEAPPSMTDEASLLNRREVQWNRCKAVNLCEEVAFMLKVGATLEYEGKSP